VTISLLLVGLLVLPTAGVDSLPAHADQLTGVVLELLEAEGWVHKKQTRDGIDVYARNLPGESKVPAGMVVKEVAVPSDAFLAVLADEESFEGFLGKVYLSDSRILNANTDEYHDVYHYLDLPPVLKDRHYVARVFFQRDRNGVAGRHLVWWTLAPEEMYAAWMTRVRATRRSPIYVETTAGCWELEPLGDGRTRVTYRLLTKPGGRLPGWAVGIGFRSSMPEMLRLLEAEARGRLERRKSVLPATEGQVSPKNGTGAGG